MPLDMLDQKTVDSLPHVRDVYEAYGVQVNALSVGEIFALYEHAGFLYPDKAARLFPHLEQVRDNWRRMLRADDSLLYVLTAGDKKRGRASLAVWRTTHHGWMSQHLVSENNPYASRAARDRKSTRLNSSHGYISYAVFCLKKKKKNPNNQATVLRSST